MEHIGTIKLGLSLILLWLFWHCAWKEYALDKFRQKLFSIRAELFDAALDGHTGLAFDSRVYGQFRLSINRLIRFGHFISFPSAVVFQLASMLPIRGNPYKSKIPHLSPFEIALEQVQHQGQKALLKRVHRKVQMAIAEYLLWTSPTFLVVITVAVPCTILCALFKMSTIAISQQMLRDTIEERNFGDAARNVEFQAETLGVANEELALAA